MSTVAPELVWGKREFAIFTIEGFAERMSGIRSYIQPKLRALGERLQAHVGRLYGEPCYAHVAKHMRRKVNPPPETWVAFSPSHRGYKQFCHYAFVVSRDGVHARLIVKSESPNRAAMAERLRKAARELARATKDVQLRSYEQWDFLGLPELIDNNEGFWKDCASRLVLKTGGLDIGIGFDKKVPASLTEAEIVKAFEQLLPICKTLTK